MAIDEKKFREYLSDKLIQLVKTERGLQTKLAKSVGKKSSFFSEINRGKPVNALHLKAIEIIFGPEKVVELLAIDENKKNKQISHPNLVALFIQKELAWSLNYSLIELEKIDPAALKDVQDYINFKIFESKTNKKCDKKETTGTKG